MLAQFNDPQIEKIFAFILVYHIEIQGHFCYI
jgi:hypothetical protein